ncbi:Protein of unknown function [Pyronema omphalodes CBS 100304]|uniref:Uncharacterized protein n=1 Tax=Pyronema omphalodes (strain CBS 100304) TaxID=1076935 RepID=U4LHC2_PYROM|nr:Protein of unknown function [Pyronema omphalodes CBS 100304]
MVSCSINKVSSTDHTADDELCIKPIDDQLGLRRSLATILPAVVISAKSSNSTSGRKC